MILQEILRYKGSAVQTVDPTTTLDEVAQTLVRHNIGSLLVMDSTGRSHGTVLGIFTERDLLRAVAAGRALSESSVAAVMTPEPLTAAPDDSLDHAMEVMTRLRIRHLPVLSAGRLCGLVSIGDLVKAHGDALEAENHCMRSYIQSADALAR